MARDFPRNVREINGRLYYRFRVGNKESSRPLPPLDDPSFALRYRIASHGRDLKAKKLKRPVGAPPWLFDLAREARKRCARRLIEFSLSADDMVEMFSRANGRCEVTGLAFQHEKNDVSLYRPFAPSLDRIDPRAGYVAANVRLVCVIVNAALNQWGEGPFWTMIEAAAERLGGKSDAMGEQVANDNRKVGRK